MNTNNILERNEFSMSRLWTGVPIMANGLLKKIALAGMVGASAMFGAKEAKGMPA